MYDEEDFICDATVEMYNAERALKAVLDTYFDKDADMLTGYDKSDFARNYEFIRVHLDLISDTLFTLRIKMDAVNGEESGIVKAHRRNWGNIYKRLDSKAG